MFGTEKCSFSTNFVISLVKDKNKKLCFRFSSEKSCRLFMTYNFTCNFFEMQFNFAENLEKNIFQPWSSLNFNHITLICFLLLVPIYAYNFNNSNAVIIFPPILAQVFKILHMKQSINTIILFQENFLIFLTYIIKLPKYKQHLLTIGTIFS